jgi:hypothetical protein
MTEPLIFTPRPSRGWVSLVVMALVFVGAGALLVSGSGGVEAMNGMLGAIVVVCGLFALLFMSLAVWFPTMYYELTDDTLAMHYGPLLHYHIPLRNVLTVGRRDLRMSLWSSMRLPGIALFGVPYRGLGRVHMCATAAVRGILLIETARAKYGLTPADENEFMAEMEARRRRQTSV